MVNPLVEEIKRNYRRYINTLLEAEGTGLRLDTDDQGETVLWNKTRTPAAARSVSVLSWDGKPLCPHCGERIELDELAIRKAIEFQKLTEEHG